jgi:putative membrane protein
MSQHEREWSKGLLAGMIGGLIGTIVMTQFQYAWTSVSKQLANGGGNGTRQSGQSEQPKKEKEDATMKAAGKIASIAGRELSHEQKKKLGPLVHYGFGTLQGAMYGAVTEMAGVPGGFLPSLVFGAALFTAADELAVPALGLSAKPSESPLSSHLYGLAAHVVYGLSTEMARRGLRAAL